MELREWALKILSSELLEDKLFTPSTLTDNSPGSPLLFKEPARTFRMRFQKRTKEEKLPPFHTHHSPDNRAVCLHRFCGHELLAVEIMAQALLLFPNAPPSFRKGVARTLQEEQEHVRLYAALMEELGLCLGDLPLYKHFWAQVPFFKTPSHYLSCMSLTFEMANLDFAPMYGASFLKYGDEKSSSLMERILADEIHHVSFGYRMLTSFHPQEDSWQAYESHLTPFLTPKRAKGFILHDDHRKKASIPPSWIERQKIY